MKEEIKESKNILVLGGGFIGCEFCSCLKLNKKEVNIEWVYLDETPVQLALGKEIGKYMEEEQRKNGVNIHP